MGWRSVFVQSPARLSVRQGQLCIETDAVRCLPPEDLDAVVLEDARSTVTAAALTTCAAAGVTVYLCDARHTPCSIVIPWNTHSRQYAVLKEQINLSLPAQKRLWQQLVQAKLRNQAACLTLCGRQEAAAQLRSRADAVLSGDSSRQEAPGAALHFTALFGPDFSRGEDCLANAALNYGYAILRRQLARLLAGYGFAPALGLHHCSEVNPFNLADDLIEPYRPLVDLLVATQVDPALPPALPAALKQQLVSLLHTDVLLDGLHQSAGHAMELTVQSLRRACSEKTPLQLPVLTGLEPHRYA